MLMFLLVILIIMTFVGLPMFIIIETIDVVKSLINDVRNAKQKRYIDI